MDKLTAFFAARLLHQKTEMQCNDLYQYCVDGQNSPTTNTDKQQQCVNSYNMCIDCDNADRARCCASSFRPVYGKTAAQVCTSKM